MFDRCLEAPIEIGGHTDSQGREEMNLNLSKARAEAVLTALRGARVKLKSLTAEGYGETQPIADNSTEEGREANRRIEFRLLTPATLEAPETQPQTPIRPPLRRPAMNRTEFIVTIAVILFVAFCLGWFANWLVHRFSRVSQSDIGELDKLAQAVHEAEEMRDKAIAYMEQRETDMNNKLSQTEAELGAAMEGLRVARTEAEELRSYIERQNSGG